MASTKTFFLVIRSSPDPSGVGQFIGAYQDEYAAEEEVVLQSQYNPETSGFYYIAEFEAARTGTLVELSGYLQNQIDSIDASGITGPQGPSGLQGPPGPSGAPGSDADAVALSGILQQQINANASGIDNNTDNLAAASGALQNGINQNAADLAQASGFLQGGIDENAANIGAASGHLQGEIDLARFQVLMTFSSGGDPAFSSSSSIYELVAIFEYPGNNHIVNPPNEMVVFASVNQANKDGAIRLYDTTNDIVIGETYFTGNTNIEQQTVAMSGLPGEPATFELQIKTVSGGGSINVYTATMI
jgi:hypothetical protein